MSKFKIKMKLTGFELEIEGSKDDLPNIQQALSQQLSGLLQPPSGIIEEEPRPEMKLISPEPVAASSRTVKPRRKSSPSTTPKTVDAEGTGPLTGWPRDVSKNYCSPSQAWTTREKGLWVLYVAQQESIANEVSAIQIRDTFNLHYRQAKPVVLGNLNRDFGTIKGTLISEDVTKKPSCWFLTDQGVAAVQKRIVGLKEGQAK